MLPGLIDGSQRACFGVTEPNSGSDTLKLQTRAIRKDDRYEITGSKVSLSILGANCTRVDMSIPLRCGYQPLNRHKRFFFWPEQVSRPPFEMQDLLCSCSSSGRSEKVFPRPIPLLYRFRQDQSRSQRDT